MRLPKRGEKGFTLNKLLIVVAILGMLAAVVIPAVQQFIGAGEEEVRETEFATIQSSVHAMMDDNEISSIPNAVAYVTPGGAVVNAVNDMTAFPDPTSDWDLVGGKLTDPTGDTPYTLLDEPGYLLQDHDKNAGDTGLVDYVVISTSEYYYTCETDGTVRQWETADTTATGTEYEY